MIVGANAPEISSRVAQFNGGAPKRGCGGCGAGSCGSSAGSCGSGGCSSAGGGCCAKNDSAIPTAPSLVAKESESLNSRLEKLINKEPVMLFMKGSPHAEKCGFSRTIVTLLEENGVKFGSFDILSDEDVRQGLKTFSNWPTYPQVYSKGKLVGGLDIIKELIENGELKETLGL